MEVLNENPPAKEIVLIMCIGEPAIYFIASYNLVIVKTQHDEL